MLGEIVLIFAPILAVFLTSWIYPMPPNEQEHKPPYQPPPWVFGVVWAYITLALGFLGAWGFRTSTTGRPYQLLFPALIVAFLCAWLVNANDTPTMTQKVTSTTLLICGGVLLCLYVAFQNKCVGNVAYILTPGIAWMFVAASLNGYLNNEAKKKFS